MPADARASKDDLFAYCAGRQLIERSIEAAQADPNIKSAYLHVQSTNKVPLLTLFGALMHSRPHAACNMSVCSDHASSKPPLGGTRRRPPTSTRSSASRRRRW
jgi:hypothetical protein